MNDEALIRPYTESDLPAVVELLRLNTPQYFAPEEEADLRHYLAHEREQYYVVEHDGGIVGCGGINLVEEGTVGRISWDIFHPHYQGRGFGGRLLAYRVAVLQALPQAPAITVRTSQLVYRFYEKSGFRLLEVVKDYWAPGYDLYRMEYTP